MLNVPVGANKSWSAAAALPQISETDQLIFLQTASELVQQNFGGSKEPEKVAFGLRYNADPAYSWISFV
jgi:hypothetical protein